MPLYRIQLKYVSDWTTCGATLELVAEPDDSDTDDDFKLKSHLKELGIAPNLIEKIEVVS